jgi:hypothetical protein
MEGKAIIEILSGSESSGNHDSAAHAHMKIDTDAQLTGRELK